MAGLVSQHAGVNCLLDCSQLKRHFSLQIHLRDRLGGVSVAVQENWSVLQLASRLHYSAFLCITDYSCSYK